MSRRAWSVYMFDWPRPPERLRRCVAMFVLVLQFTSKPRETVRNSVWNVLCCQCKMSVWLCHESQMSLARWRWRWASSESSLGEGEGKISKIFAECKMLNGRVHPTCWKCAHVSGAQVRDEHWMSSPRHERWKLWTSRVLGMEKGGGRLRNRSTRASWGQLTLEAGKQPVSWVKFIFVILIVQQEWALEVELTSVSGSGQRPESHLKLRLSVVKSNYSWHTWSCPDTWCRCICATVDESLRVTMDESLWVCVSVAVTIAICLIIAMEWQLQMQCNVHHQTSVQVLWGRTFRTTSWFACTLILEGSIRGTKRAHNCHFHKSQLVCKGETSRENMGRVKERERERKRERALVSCAAVVKWSKRQRQRSKRGMENGGEGKACRVNLSLHLPICVIQLLILLTLNTCMCLNNNVHHRSPLPSCLLALESSYLYHHIAE